MDKQNAGIVIVENYMLKSEFLVRDVIVDCYLPGQITDTQALSLLLVNDGQDLVTMNFAGILEELYQGNNMQPLFCVGIHCSSDRKNEYGTAKILDYKGRGAKAALYTRFIFEELLPFIRMTYNISSFKEKSYAGISYSGRIRHSRSERIF